MSYSPIRTPEQIRQDCARKLRRTKINEDFLAVLGCLLDEPWTTPRLVEMFISSEGYALARPEDMDYFAKFLGRSSDLLKNIHSVARLADLDGDEVGYLVAKIVEVKRHRQP